MPDRPLVEGRRRVVIEDVRPAVDHGRFPLKRTAGQQVIVSADVFADGHDAIACALLFRREPEEAWQELPMQPLGNDRWEATFTVDQIGRWHYTLQGWIDWFQTWLRDMQKRIDAEQDIGLHLAIGADLIGRAAKRAAGADRDRLVAWQELLVDPGGTEFLRSPQIVELVLLMGRYPDKSEATTCDVDYSVVVDVEKASFSSWYEMFPRSTSPQPGRHGTFRDCIARLPYVAEMGFDVLYLPPIHPIGTAFRKGKNNVLVAQPGEPGSPWGIGAAKGGHTAIHAELGTLEDFKELIARAKEFEIDIALDIALQCSPDHPYVRAHPKWFRHRPDGSIQYAENPPKKYQDIYPLDFESPDWRSLWQELRDVFEYWIAQGVGLFRVDNPHTKPFAFWEWLITDLKSRHPEVILLSEAFTRPKVMYRLAKLGFSQSYTYFTWRNSKAELVQYFTELTSSDLQEFFRPNLWPNTPDILPEHLQVGGRGAFIVRVVMAATLASNYGIYGPAFELLEHEPREPGSEEYLNSEKYEIRHWELDRPDSLRGVISRLNRARQTNPALKANLNLLFHETGNDHLLCYTKRSEQFNNLVLTVVNLDFHNAQQGWLDLPLGRLGLSEDRPFQVRDVLSDTTFRWQGARNFVELPPHSSPAHVFVVEQ